MPPLWTPRGAPVPALVWVGAAPATPLSVTLPYCEPWEMVAPARRAALEVVRIAAVEEASEAASDDAARARRAAAERTTTETVSGGMLRVWLEGERGGVARMRHAWEPPPESNGSGEGDGEPARIAATWTACRDDPDEPFFMQVLLALGSVASALAVVAVLLAQKMEDRGKRA